MKTFYVVFVANVIFFRNVLCGLEEMRGRLTTLANSCLDESGATPEMVNKSFDGVFPEDASFKELLYCMGKHQHFFDASGMVDESSVRTAVKGLVGDEAMANSLVDKCLTQAGTPQEKAYNIAQCMYSTATERFS